MKIGPEEALAYHSSSPAGKLATRRHQTLPDSA